MNGLDRNGYAPSIVPNHSEYECWLCGRNGCGKMDRHEVFFGVGRRQKSKRFGLWVHLCNIECHLYGVHVNEVYGKALKKEAQRCAMQEYGWTVDDFIREFGRNYLED